MNISAQIHLERRGEARRSVDSAGTAGRLIHMFTVSGLISDWLTTHGYNVSTHITSENSLINKNAYRCTECRAWAGTRSRAECCIVMLIGWIPIIYTTLSFMPYTIWTSNLHDLGLVQQHLDFHMFVWSCAIYPCRTLTFEALRGIHITAAGPTTYGGVRRG